MERANTVSKSLATDDHFSVSLSTSRKADSFPILIHCKRGPKPHMTASTIFLRSSYRNVGLDIACAPKIHQTAIDCELLQVRELVLLRFSASGRYGPGSDGDDETGENL